MNGQASQVAADILVIGAGPAGLSLGFELKRRGLAFVILEKGATAGESWRRMPSNWKLVSPWKSNRLPGTRKDSWPRHYEVSRAELHSYLREYAQTNALPVRANVEVLAVERTAGGLFRARTSQGEFISRLVVNATGYFCNPFVPEIPGARESRVPQLHVAHYQDAENVKSVLGRTTGLILIVGKRLSAGQAMVELVDAGFEVALSRRSPIKFGVGPVAWWFFFRIFPWLEWVKVKCLGAQARSNDVRMQGGRARRLIESGRVKTFPPIRRFERDQILFCDGSSLSADLVIYATGFRPALQHLAPLALAADSQSGRPALRDLESLSTPGLYFVGLDRTRNFQSRFLRGIRKDVVVLAGRLAKQMTPAGFETKAGDIAVGS